MSWINEITWIKAIISNHEEQDSEFFGLLSCILWDILLNTSPCWEKLVIGLNGLRICLDKDMIIKRLMNVAFSLNAGVTIPFHEITFQISHLWESCCRNIFLMMILLFSKFDSVSISNLLQQQSYTSNKPVWMECIDLNDSVDSFGKQNR